MDKIDVVFEEVQPHHYKEEEDLTKFRSEKCDRGPFQPDWMENSEPVMCSYKVVEVSMELWGLQGRLEEFAHRVRAFRIFFQFGDKIYIFRNFSILGL